MNTDCEIKTNNDTEHINLMCILYSLGYKYHDEASPMDAHTQFKRYSYTNIVSNGKYCGGNYERYSEKPLFDMGKDLDAIFKHFGMSSPKTYVIEDVGDYQAIVKKDGVKVGCQDISFEKVKEIYEATLKFA